MTIALDFGSHQLRSLRRVDDRLVTRTMRCQYAVLPDSPSHRQLLGQAGISYIVSDGGLLLAGDAAWNSAELFRTPCRSLLPSGRLPEHDPLARQIVGMLVEGVLPQATTPGSLCSVSLPTGVDIDGSDARSDLEFFTRLVRLRGYEPRIVPAGQALILATQVRSAFTGIALIFGASGCEAVLAHRGAVLCHARTDQGGDWLDQQLAGHPQHPVLSNRTSADEVARKPEPLALTRARESQTAPASLTSGSFQQALVRQLATLTASLLDAFATELSRTPAVAGIPQPLAVTCGGGLIRTPGFASFLTRTLSGDHLPVQLQTPLFVADTDPAIARGLLVSSLLEATPRPSQARPTQPRSATVRHAA